jgi:hypothetical protein
MTWKSNRDEKPTENGWYYVWRMADEGEGQNPAEWSGEEEWKIERGGWEFGDWGIVKFWDVCFPDAEAAEAAGHAIPNP